VASAISSSNLSLNPQADPHNPLQLNVSIPPPTKESRDHVIQTAKKAAEKAGMSVRDARGAMHKKLKAMKTRPDDLRKAHEMMEKVARKGQEDVKGVLDNAVKGLEGA
jgi:ribosome recycling factor